MRLAGSSSGWCTSRGAAVRHPGAKHLGPLTPPASNTRLGAEGWCSCGAEPGWSRSWSCSRPTTVARQHRTSRPAWYRMDEAMSQHQLPARGIPPPTHPTCLHHQPQLTGAPSSKCLGGPLAGGGSAEEGQGRIRAAAAASGKPQRRDLPPTAPPPHQHGLSTLVRPGDLGWDPSGSRNFLKGLDDCEQHQRRLV